jgi:predicted N-formylglutamate amidohydrolase
MIHPLVIAGDAPILLVADHASNAVPPDIELGIDPRLLDEHVAVDIGTAALTRTLAAELRAGAVIAGVSRLVIDLNREPEAPGLVPAASDGHVIPGNAGLTEDERRQRIARFHMPYHDAIASRIDAAPPRLVVAMHSFTPRLATRPEEARPWPVGILYNADARAAAPAIAALRARGLSVGDNEPYSGRVLNYTMNRHAEARRLPYINVEVRQDELATAEDVARWRNILAETITETLSLLPSA